MSFISARSQCLKLGRKVLINFLQLRRFLDSPDGSTNTGESLMLSHFPIAVISLHTKVLKHCNDVAMGAIASQITSLTIGYSIGYSDADQRKHQSSAPLAFVRKMFPFHDVTMEWHKLGHVSRVVFWVVKTIDGASIDLTCDFESENSCCIAFVWATSVK